MMSYYMSMFFYTELTCIPQLLDKYIIGKYYNNAIGNALTWVLIMWLFIHYIFNTYLNILMRKMQYKQYQRRRLLNSLWFAGFYGTGFLYCLATIVKNNINFPDYRNNLALDGGIIPLHILMGLGLIGTFFCQCFIWNCFNEFYSNYSLLNYMALTLFSVFAFYSRRVELFLSILGLMCLSNFMFEVTRCVKCSIVKGSEIYIKGMLWFSLGMFYLLHGLVIPFFLIAPLIYGMRNDLSISLILLLINVLTWWICEFISSPACKYINHWIYHTDTKNPKICPDSLLECTLFPIRDDLSFDMALIKQEIKARNDSMIAKRKPRGKGVLVQTLKCMVAIKRKLKKQRAVSSESDEKDQNNEDEGSSSEEEDSSSSEEDPIKKEYLEETAKALQEDQENSSQKQNLQLKENEEEEDCKKDEIVEEISADDKKND